MDKEKELNSPSCFVRRLAAREVLTDLISSLEAEKPKYLFNTSGWRERLIRNESGSDITGDILVRRFLLMTIPGDLNEIKYKGLEIEFPKIIKTYNHIGPAEKDWEKAHRPHRDNDFTFYFSLNGTNYDLHPVSIKEDYFLTGRIVDVFKKYIMFVRETKEKSKLSLKLHNFGRKLKGQYTK